MATKSFAPGPLVQRCRACYLVELACFAPAGWALLLVESIRAPDVLQMDRYFGRCHRRTASPLLNIDG